MMHFDRIQIETAEAAGIRPPIAEGPSHVIIFYTLIEISND